MTSVDAPCAARTVTGRRAGPGGPLSVGVGRLGSVRTVVLGSGPKEIGELIEHRRATGADRFDEVWNGDYHMAPAPSAAHALTDDELAAVLRPLARARGLVGSGPFNLGGPGDYRVPDRGLHRDRPTGSWVATAALVVEILSPDDESWSKLPFYASHGVEEVVMADPATSTLTWLACDGDTFRPVERSELLDVVAAEVATAIAWPDPD